MKGLHFTLEFGISVTDCLNYCKFNFFDICRFLRPFTVRPSLQILHVLSIPHIGIKYGYFSLFRSISVTFISVTYVDCFLSTDLICLRMFRYYYDYYPFNLYDC